MKEVLEREESKDSSLLTLNKKILSDVTIFNKYAKYIPELERRETWEEICLRNAEMHIKKFPKLKDKIREVYNDFVIPKKILPSMRTLQFAGKPIEVNNARLYNCSYLPIDDLRAFNETMFLLLSGCGVGYSVQLHHIEKLPEIKSPNKARQRKFLIGDSIEGWADAIKVLIKSYFQGSSEIVFDFSDIRDKGLPLLTSGGKAPGPQPLKECLIKIKGILDNKSTGNKLSSLECHDILCHISDAVLAGGIRRASSIALFSADDEDMLTCKFGNWWELNPQRARANNSAILLRHKITESFFKELWKKVELSNCGEPGIILSNDKDMGYNPCVEAGLKPFTFCNLNEINVPTIESQEDFNKRCEAISFLGTLQASYTDFHYLRDIWKRNTEKDSLLGVSLTGTASGVLDNLDIKEGVSIIKATNKKYADIIGINKAKRLTCIKPAGTSSIVLGTSSGIHSYFEDYYIRRIRMISTDPLCKYLLETNPKLVEKDQMLKDTYILTVPQKSPDNAITRTNETTIEFLNRIKKYYKEWVLPGHTGGSNTHNISATVSIRDNEWKDVGNWIWENREFYNGLSFLPYDGGIYVQPPFEKCSKETYEELDKYLTDIDLTKVNEKEDNTDLQGELACSGGACEIT
jgi:ribonucleoside-triphosphate reductase